MQGNGVVYETNIKGTLHALSVNLKNVLENGLSLSHLMVQIL
jgi:hypothetical protein